jgi:hypothetical protein
MDSSARVPRRARRPSPRRWRPWLAAITIGALLTAVLAAAAPAQSSYTPGSATAGASVAGVAVIYNNANIGINVLATDAQYADSSAKGSAGPVRIGIIDLISTLQICGASPIPPQFLPKVATADTNDQPGKIVEASTTGPGVSHARAAPGADGAADSGGVDLAVPGAVSVSGGTSHSEAKTDERTQTRTAAATADVGTLSILGGAIQLSGMQWRLVQRVVGADERSAKQTVTSSFTVGSLRIGGLPIPLPAAPDQAIDAINKATGPLGVRFSAPHLTPVGKGFRLSPMTTSLGGNWALASTIAQLASSPAINTLEQAIVGGLFDTKTCNALGGLLKASPQLNASYNSLGLGLPILLAAATAAFGGGGSVDLHLGGVETSIDDAYYPITTFAAGTGSSTNDATAGAATEAGSASSAGASAPTSADGSGTVGTGATVAHRRAASVGPLHCSTTSPAARPGCWRDRAVIGGLVVGLTGVGALVLDETMRRRRRLLGALGVRHQP